MNTKQFILTVLLGLTLAAVAFAGGNGERMGGPWDQERFEEMKALHDEAKEALVAKVKSLPKKTLTGDIALKNRFLPELTSNGEVYELTVIPGYILRSEIAVADGDNVTVEVAEITDKTFADLEDVFQGGRGYMHDARGLEEGKSLFLVTKLTVNGKTYDLVQLFEEKEYGPYGQGGRMGCFKGGPRGMMGGGRGWK